MRWWILLASCAFFVSTAQGQLSLKPIPHVSNNQFKATSKNTTGRTETTRLTLPFWDDFSYYTSQQPIDSIWSSYNTVTINDGMAIKPVSLKVATFDGYNELGKPYNVGDNGLAKGFADSLVSQPIDLTTITFDKQETVYLSFYYQAQGNGEVPDSGDKLEIFFKGPLGWELVDDNIEGGAGPDSIFHFKIIQVAPSFFHKNFQFKFKNFGRLSGPYDTWNIDYVYLNQGRDTTDSSFPDRTISTPPSSLFTDYWSIPYNHFKANSSTHFNDPSCTLYNLKVGPPQPFNYGISTEVTSYTGSTSTIITSATDSVSVDKNLNSLEFLRLTLKSGISSFSFDPLADSATIQLKVGIKSGDNVPITSTKGDYKPEYSPIDFRYNDFSSITYKLFNYYAYDDGTAEYAAGLNQAGSLFAYQFATTLNTPDTVRNILIQFPNFEEQSNQVFELRIWKSISDTNPILLYKQIVSVSRKSNNQFTTYVLDPSQLVVVQGTFYVGWKQNSTARMDVGFDANTDNGTKIFYNTTGTWTQNTDLKGSLMVRPVFGKSANSSVTGLENATTETFVYPNPSNGVFYVPLIADQITIYDSMGKEITFQMDIDSNGKRIEVLNRKGLFIVRMFMNNQWVSSRVIID